MKAFLKYIGCIMIRFCFRFFSAIPIDKDKVLFMSYAGKQYSCNPRAISEYIEEKNPDKKIVWVMDDAEHFSHKVYKVVRPRTVQFYYHHWTAKAIVTNGITFREIPIRRKQQLINTWHGGGAYKRVVFDNPSVKRSKFEKKLLYNRDEKRTVFLSSCKMASEFVISRGLGHSGKILEIGSPRNDIFMSEKSEKIKSNVKEYFEISESVKIFLYAPTFRDSKRTDLYNIDFDLIKEALSRRFGGEWVVMTRMHQLIDSRVSKSYDVISASDYYDMQDLLVAADAFMTDYSSSIWDYSLTYKPAFLYMPDIEEYKGERNFYSRIDEWPFEYAETVDELIKIIDNYDDLNAKNRIDYHFRQLVSFEKGDASKRVVDYVFK